MLQRRPLSRRAAVTRAVPLLALGAMLAACGSPTATPRVGAPQAAAPGAVTGTSATAAATATAAPRHSAAPTPHGTQAPAPGATLAPVSAATAKPTAGPTAAPTAKPTPRPSAPATSGTSTPAGLSWNLVVYYTPVETYYHGAMQAITGCGPAAPDSCSMGTTALGSYPSDFLTAVNAIDDGAITSGPYSGDYLSWDDTDGWSIDTTLTDSNGNPMQPYVTAQADVPLGTHFTVTSCGTQGGAPIAPSVCSPLTAGNWTVTDSNDGNTATEVDLYVGRQDSETFAGSALATMNSSGARTTLPAPIPNDN